MARSHFLRSTKVPVGGPDLFLQGLENPNGGVVLASLNFPVTLVYANGNTLEVNNNQELEEAINAAEDDCDDVIVNLKIRLP